MLALHESTLSPKKREDKVKKKNEKNPVHSKLISPLFRSPMPVLGVKVKQDSVMWSFLKINLSTTLLSRRSRRELSIHMLIVKSSDLNKLLSFVYPHIIKTFIRLPVLKEGLGITLSFHLRKLNVDLQSKSSL